MIKQRIFLPAAVLAGSFGLAACGGGGGSAGVPGNPAPPDSSLLNVNAGNYQALGQATVSSAFYLGDAGGTLSGAGVGGNLRLLRQAADVARRAVGEARARAAQFQPGLSSGADLRQTLSCSGGGAAVLSISDANNNGNIDIGDAVTLDAQACQEDGSILQGRISLSMQALTGVFYGNSFNATLAMTLTAFSATHGGDSVQGDGTLSLTLSETPAGVSELSLSTPRLVLSGQLGGQAFSTTLTDILLTLRVEPQVGGRKSSLSYSGGLSSSNLGNQQVLITTRLPLVATGSDAYPSGGQWVVKGSGNSTLRITSLNATQARLELDTQGDGVNETQVVKTWAELR
ncbi:hypothetical protein ASC95_17545 [Pelomonas sp. Root1217]|uniref:hypothetical protein n=1 Tax=Pelomonas sp. Root1217 TaxID=1736430 RepID=UPI00070D6897|nr:hypothetical protein [Pelomonas sp. Root1217]KQV49405.1 hypothetical protein ASC95_17545 [Pelomonas sp. Root1217]